MINIMSQEEIEEIIEDSHLPVLVKFGAEWCKPCKTLEPILEQLAEEYNGKILFYYIDVDKSKEITMHYGISGVPTIILFKDEMTSFRTVGVRTKKFIKGELDKCLQNNL